MKLKKAIIVALVLSVMGYLSNTAWADIYCEQSVITRYKIASGQEVSKTTHQRLYLKPGLLKIENVESGKTTIVNLANQVILNIFPADKTYTSLDFQSLKLEVSQEEMAAGKRKPQVGAGQEKIREELVKTMPKEQRSMMEQMMMAQMAKMRKGMEGDTGGADELGPAELKPTPDVKTMLGHRVKRFKVIQTINGRTKKVVELWLTTEVEPRNFFADFTEPLALFRTGATNELKKAVGFPLKMKYRIQRGPLKGNLQSVTVTKLEVKNLPITEFDVPVGYMPTGATAAAPIEEEESF